MEELDLGATIRGFSAGQKVLGRYTLRKLLGRGGMGVVWLAYDDELEQELALKFLPEIVALDKEAVRDLKRETRRSLQLTHPQIVRIYDFVQDARTAAIAMEYVPGDTLAARKVDQPHGHFEVAEIAEWMKQLLEALEYAHGRVQLVHRDLKPANLMVDRRGALKVADFGIAASVSDSVSRVSAQAGSSGTPLYMSPQQMMGEPPAVTDDIYSFGATLYELLTGKPPFFSGNVLLQVREKTAPSMADRRRELGGSATPIPPEWERTIAECLAKDPQQRPQSARTVADRLGLSGPQRIAAAAPVRATPTDPNAPRSRAGDATASRTGSGRRKFLAVLAAALVPLAASMWYLGVFRPEQARIESIAAAEDQSRQAIGNRIARFTADSSEADRDEVEAAVKAYLAEAPERFRAEVAQQWRVRLDAWEAVQRAAQAERNRAAILARIDAMVDGSPDAVRQQVDAAVAAYLKTAPAGMRHQVETRWSARLAGWETARAAAARGAVAIRTIPAGAEITLAGVAHGRSPISVRDLRPGRFEVTARLDGHVDWTGEIEVRPESLAQLEIPLARKSGRLVVGGTVGAQVSRDGQVLGRIPLDMGGVPVGQVRLQVTAPGYHEAVLAGEVTHEGVLRLNAELDRIQQPVAGRAWSVLAAGRLEMVPISPGTFQMGQEGGDSDEYPVMEVTLTQHYWIGKTEVTQAQWTAVMGENPSVHRGPDLPVENITWEQAMEFCFKLTAKEYAAGRLPSNFEYTLPTEAQWEYAARAGAPSTTTADIDEVAWYFRNSGNRTQPVGSKKANAWGLHDMRGNVYELCLDWYGRYPGGRHTDFARLDQGVSRAGRGGSFYAAPADCDVVDRTAHDADSSMGSLGFRLVLAPHRPAASRAGR